MGGGWRSGCQVRFSGDRREEVHKVRTGRPEHTHTRACTCTHDRREEVHKVRARGRQSWRDSERPPRRARGTEARPLYICAHAAPPSARMAEWYVYKVFRCPEVPGAIQVCVAHRVIAWEQGRAESRDLGTENSRHGESGPKGAARTRGLEFCCINLYAHTTPLSAQAAEWYVHQDFAARPNHAASRPAYPPAHTRACMCTYTYMRMQINVRPPRARARSHIHTQDARTERRKTPTNTRRAREHTHARARARARRWLTRATPSS